MNHKWVFRVTGILVLSSALVANSENLLFIGGQPDAAQGDDGFVLDHLEELGHDVTYIAANESFADDADGMDAILLSSTPGSGDMRGKFSQLEIPILQWEEALVRWDHGDPDGNFRMSESSRNGQGRETTFINIVESAVGHPLTAGLAAGPHEIFEDPSRTPQQFGELAPGLIRIAELDEDFADDIASIYFDEDGNEVESGELVLTAIEKGGQLGPEDEDHFAPERRVNFPIEDTGFDLLNDTGIALFNCSLEWILGRNCLGDDTLTGDYDNDGMRGPSDLDAQAAAIMNNDASFDLDGDGDTDDNDRKFFVEELSNTYFGDANFDGEFSSADFVVMFTAGKYENGQAAGWAEGDFNGDGVFTSGDFVIAFTGGGYEKGPRDGGIQVVPEPSSIVMLAIGLMTLAASRRRR